MPSTMLFGINNDGRVLGLSTNGTKWREFPYLGVEFTQISAVPHYLWAIGGDRQVYVHVHGLDVPIRIKEEAYENQRWIPIGGFGTHFLPTDRCPWSSKDGLVDRSRDKIRLPSMAWQWESDWQLELSLDGQPLDKEGWTYAVDFPMTYQPQKQWTSTVRRRKWFRYRRYSAMNSWCAISPLHKDPTEEPFIDVSVGGKKLLGCNSENVDVWAVTAQGRVMWRTGVTSKSPEGVRWTEVSLPRCCEVRQISCGPAGLLWVVLWNGRVLIRIGITQDTPTGDYWLEVGPPEPDLKITQVSVGINAAWAISNDNRVWFRKGVRSTRGGRMSDELARGSGWVEMVGSMSYVSITDNDQVWAIGCDDRKIYCRVGVTSSELTGKKWKLLCAPTQVESKRKESLVPSAPSSLLFDTTKSASEALEMNCGNEVDQSRRSVPACSPTNRGGTLLAMEANPEVDDKGLESISFQEREDDSISGDLSDSSWSCISAGALNLDPSSLPNWFTESQSSQVSSAPWRTKILDELKISHAKLTDSFEHYELAVEMKSWVSTGKCRVCLQGSQTFEDCSIELEWIGCKTGSLDFGTFSILTPDRTRTKAQLSLNEITCVTNVSEPGTPLLALHTVCSTRLKISPLQLQFTSDTQFGEWLASFSSVCAQLHDAQGAPHPSSVWGTTALGEVYVFDPSTLEAKQLKNNLFYKEFDVKGKSVPWVLPLLNNFPPGSKIVLEGMPSGDDPNRFAIDFECGLPGDIALHLNPRMKERIFVRNSKKSSSWGAEDRDGPWLFNPGREFKLQIECQEEGFRIILNAMPITYFEHRLNPEGITDLRVGGDVIMSNVTYATPNAILDQEELYWRQIGGHLDIVESCASGVTWGLGLDKVPWVYTGGWGGAFLGGLEQTNINIHPMEDTFHHYVYENQRWNPFGGYTTHGLPTDRPMWSDETGREKRSFETTKLPNSHWQWVADWCIDYDIPGGADKDGWQYAIDFPASYHPQNCLTDTVRRRRWYRSCKFQTSGPWQEVGSTKLQDVSLFFNEGAQCTYVWGIAVNGDTLFRRGVSSKCPMGDSWEHVPNDLALTNISCGSNNQVWAIGRNGCAFWRIGINTSNPVGDMWEAVEAPSGRSLTKVTVGKCGIWVLDSEGCVFVRREVTPVFPEGSFWQQIDCASDGNFLDISADKSDVWAITVSRTVCLRSGITPENPGGSLWIPGLSALQLDNGKKPVNQFWFCRPQLACGAHPVNQFCRPQLACGAEWANWKHISVRGLKSALG